MNINSQQLISELQQLNERHLRLAEDFLTLTDEQLNHKPAPDSWSALECIEHLNRYGAFYLPEIRRRMETSSGKPTATFRTGLLGNYFANSMKPKEQLNKMKTFQNMNPAGSALTRETLHTFIAQSNELNTLLARGLHVNLRQVKTAVSISKFIRLRLGDTFRFFTYHNDRHWVQAQRAIQSAGIKK